MNCSRTPTVAHRDAGSGSQPFQQRQSDPHPAWRLQPPVRWSDSPENWPLSVFHHLRDTTGKLRAVQSGAPKPVDFERQQNPAHEGAQETAAI